MILEREEIMLDYVQELLEQEDNIIDQLKLLKEHHTNFEVKLYIKALLTTACPYTKYCIYKYYYNIDVKEVKPSITKLNNIFFKDLARVQSRINTRINNQLISHHVQVGNHVLILDNMVSIDGIVKEVYDNHFIITVNLFGEPVDIEAKLVMKIE